MQRPAVEGYIAVVELFVPGLARDAWPRYVEMSLHALYSTISAKAIPDGVELDGPAGGDEVLDGRLVPVFHLASLGL